MSEEKVTPAQRLENVRALVEQSISALWDVHSWLQEGDIEQAQAALESASEPLADIEDWLDDASEGSPSESKETP